MNGKISRAEIICFLPGFLCKFAEYFTGVYTVLLYDPVFYKDNFKNAGAEKKKRINSAENKSRSESERQCMFILSLKDQY